jgi:hypothetical protein
MIVDIDARRRPVVASSQAMMNSLMIARRQ